MDCPPGATCPGGNRIVAGAGFWRTSILSRRVMPCPYDTCKGENLNGSAVCQAGSSGPLCGVCEHGFFLDGWICQECRVFRRIFLTVTVIVLFLTAAAVGFLTFTRFLSHSSIVTLLRSIDIQRCKSAWVCISIIGSISWTTKIIWPPPLSYFAGAYSALSEISFVPMACIDSSVNFHDALILSTALPLVLVMLSWICTAVAPAVVSHERAVQFTLLVAFIVLPFTSTRIFQTFIFTEFSDGSRLLTADLSLGCEGPVYEGMFVFSVIQCCVFPIGVPAMFMCVLWSHRESIVSRDPTKACPQELQHIAFLFEYYSNAAYFWEVVECVRRLLLSSALILTGGSSGSRAMWGTFLSAIFSIACREF